ncbi:Probable transmembrane protein [hydrothermal vent metagenome]|uniref:Probable transmembrane protein n=1 Tax=hydrothermal vent metagenome TaxID=652676 RepID=A0A3B0Y6U4_9ZZZZ
MNDVVTGEGASTEGTANIVYILYMVGVVIGVTGIIGVIMAYVNKAEAPEWLKSHYQFQIRTFWIGGLYLFIGGILSLILIGWLVLLFWVVWLIVRSVKGMKSLDKKEAHPNPTGWMF